MESEDLKLKNKIVRMIMESYGKSQRQTIGTGQINLKNNTKIDLVFEFDQDELLFKLDYETKICSDCKKIIDDLSIKQVLAKQIIKKNDELEDKILSSIVELKETLLTCQNNKHETETRDTHTHQEEIKSHIVSLEGNERTPETTSIDKLGFRIKILNPDDKPKNETLIDSPKTEPLPAHSSVNLSVFLEYQVKQENIKASLLQSTCQKLKKHSEQSNYTKREVGGLLVGDVSKGINDNNDCIYWVLITDIIPFESNNSSISHLTIEKEDWLSAESIFQRDFEPIRKKKIGWYHTHPEQGIFFSPLDSDAHSVFNFPWQMAFVINPQNYKVGLFHWEVYQETIKKSIEFSLKYPADHTIDQTENSSTEFDTDFDTDEIDFWKKIILWTIPIVGAPVLWVIHYWNYSEFLIPVFYISWFLLYFTPSQKILSLWQSSKKKSVESEKSFSNFFRQCRRLIVIIIFFVFIAVVIVALFFYQFDFMTPPKLNNGQEDISNFQEKAEVSIGPQAEKVIANCEIKGNEQKLEIKLNNDSIAYEKKENEWKLFENSEAEEKRFYKDSIKININGKSSEVESLQKFLEISSDGDWGVKTRNRLADKTLEAVTQGKKNFVVKQIEKEIVFEFK